MQKIELKNAKSLHTKKIWWNAKIAQVDLSESSLPLFQWEFEYVF